MTYKLHDALRLLEAAPPSQATDDAQKALKPLEKLDEDLDLAWAVARVVFLLGPWGPRRPSTPDVSPAEVRAAVQAALDLAKVKRMVFVRVGDSTWTKLVVAGLWPVTSCTDTKDRAIMLPKPPLWHRYIQYPACPGESLIKLSFSGMLVREPWPRFEPPLVRLLASAVPGSAKLSPDTNPKTGT